MRDFAGRNAPWSRIDPERRNGVLLVGGIVVVILFAIGLIAYGYYNDRIAPQHDTVIKVGDKGFDYSYVERRARADLVRGRLDTRDLGNSLYNLMVRIQREQLVREASAALGISVTEAEIEERYRTKLNLTEESTREQFAARLKAELLSTGLSLDDYHAVTAVEVLERKLRAQFESEVPSQAEQVDLQLIEVETQAEALKARDSLNEGRGFGVLAVEVSTYAQAQQNAGDLSWTPRGAVPPEVAEAAFSIELNVISDLIEGRDAYYLIRVNGKETREVTTDAKNRIVEQSLDTAIADARETHGAEITMTTQQIQRLALSVSSSGV
jgi:foldase protein PrsA